MAGRSEVQQSAAYPALSVGGKRVLDVIGEEVGRDGVAISLSCFMERGMCRAAARHGIKQVELPRLRRHQHGTAPSQRVPAQRWLAWAGRGRSQAAGAAGEVADAAAREHRAAQAGEAGQGRAATHRASGAVIDGVAG
jgi:hypothetical protein